MIFQIQRFATGFVDPKVAVLKVEVNTDVNGNIINRSDNPFTEVGGTKIITFNGFKATGSLAEAETVFDTVLSQFFNAEINSESAQRTVTAKVGETA